MREWWTPFARARRPAAARPLVLARAALISSGVVGAVPSHQTAARVHQIVVPEDVRVQLVTVTRKQRRRNRPDLHFYPRSLGYGEVARREGVPVTTVARTLADLATSLERVPAVWALDDALRRRLCAKADIIAVIERWRGGTGCVSARDRLDEADGKAESILETARSCFLRSLAAKRLTGVGLDRAALHLVGRDARPRGGSRHCAAHLEPARILRPAPSSGVGDS